MQNSLKVLIATAAASLALLTSCGGGGSASITPPDNRPAAGTADLLGQLVQGARSASAVGDSLSGVPVSLINAVSGALVRSGVSDASGRFEFKAVPSGKTMLLKVEFTSSSDLDGDGQPDQVELNFPLSLNDQSVSELVQQIGLTDTNGDDSPDSVEVEIELGDDNGRSETTLSQHRHGEGRTVEDSNSNGEIDDSDSSFDDSDCNGLPDGSGELSERELRGAIEALTTESITVGGVNFMITSATEWQVGENQHASPAAFNVGQLVKVEGFTSAEGVLIAREVKDQAALVGGEDDNHSGGGDDGSDDVQDEDRELIGIIDALSSESITVAGLTFAISSLTEWQVGENSHATPAEFAVGQRVKIEGMFDANGILTAIEVKDEAAFAGSGDGDDDSSDDDSSDDKGADDDSSDENDGDDVGDDNDGESGDDDSGDDVDDDSGDESDDDNGGDDVDDDVDDNNSGQDGDDESDESEDD